VFRPSQSGTLAISLILFGSAVCGSSASTTKRLNAKRLTLSHRASIARRHARPQSEADRIKLLVLNGRERIPSAAFRPNVFEAGYPALEYEGPLISQLPDVVAGKEPHTNIAEVSHTDTWP
jgi:hypothetical protein